MHCCKDNAIPPHRCKRYKLSIDQPMVACQRAKVTCQLDLLLCTAAQLARLEALFPILAVKHATGTPVKHRCIQKTCWQTPSELLQPRGIQKEPYSLQVPPTYAAAVRKSLICPKIPKPAFVPVQLVNAYSSCVAS